MDATAYFLECVEEKACRPKVRARKRTEVDDIVVKVHGITKLKEFLLENRKHYINTRHSLNVQDMSDCEREKIDANAEAVLQTLNRRLDRLKVECSVAKSNLPDEYLNHRAAVVEIVECYLKAVCKIQGVQRAIRVKRAVDMKKMSRLETLVRHGVQHCPLEQQLKLCSATFLQRFSHDGDALHSQVANQIPASSSMSDNSINHSDGLRKRKGLERHYTGEKVPSEHNMAETISHGYSVDTESNIINHLLPEEIDQFQKENELVYRECTSTIDEMAQIEDRVMEIAKLQDIFTEKILIQDQDISRIHDTTVGSTEELIAANEQIREAMKRKATTRIYMMFTLIVLTFTLLFLDWYNP